MRNRESIIWRRIVLGLSKWLLILTCCLSTAVLSPAWAQTVPSRPWISADDPLITNLKIEAETIRRRREKAQALWEGLTPQAQESIRAALRKQADVSEIVHLLRYEQKTEAEALVMKLYKVDKRQAAVIASLIGYANGIE